VKDIGELLERRWEPVLEQLRSEGFEARITSLIAPLQLEGTLPSGEAFYFRSEWGGAWLSLGGEDPVFQRAWASWKDWEDRKRGEENPVASLIELKTLLERWRAGEPDMRQPHGRRR
jgi:hypothetical protein